MVDFYQKWTFRSKIEITKIPELTDEEIIMDFLGIDFGKKCTYHLPITFYHLPRNKAIGSAWFNSPSVRLLLTMDQVSPGTPYKLTSYNKRSPINASQQLVGEIPGFRYLIWFRE